jgi:glutamate-1-semialdehyde 2,1-aminomutase
MINHWTWNEYDQQVAEELQARIPDKVFDAHAHLYRKESLVDKGELVKSGPDVCGVQIWREYVERQVGKDRLKGGLLFPYPQKRMESKILNDEIAIELKKDPNCRGLMLIGPKMSAEEAENSLAECPQFVGFKPYHIMATVEPTFEAPIDTYVPEWAWKIADERGLLIMLHMVRERALADPDNKREIIEKCEKYPNMKLVLAHAARGFNGETTALGIRDYSHLHNLYFDTSAICEAKPIAAILKTFGPKRLMWASDFPVSDQRGKSVSIGNSFSWINPERMDIHPTAYEIKTSPVGLENLRAFLDACDQCYLNQQDLEDVFYNTAQRLLGIEITKEDTGQMLYKHAKTRIPAGGHLLSKRPEMMAPGQWPPYFSEVRGCSVWDLDRRHYYDFSINGVGAAMLGFNDPDVTRAVMRRIQMGSISSLNPPEELDLADKLCQLHPWADCARFTRTGGEMTSVAIRIARATTNRSKVAICGYHGWSDWYLAANLGEDDSLDSHLLAGLNPSGVPRELSGTTLTFNHNSREEFDELMDTSGDELAAIMMEPCRSADPEPGFLEHVRKRTTEKGIILIFDEITIGWRLALGGAHLKFGVAPDMAVFGKTLGNGFPIAAVIGTESAMAGAHHSFISSSYWTEAVGPTAALATLKKMEETNAVHEINNRGQLIREAIKAAAAKHEIDITLSGYNCTVSFAFNGNNAQALRTLYTQCMLEKGFLATPMIYVTLAHTEYIIERFAKAVNDCFAEITEHIQNDRVESSLKGDICHSGFKRLI